ncbi:hypothetical protein NMY22_g8703 [Coprinellus aureogranulatus]|nr:hypothetical protein NMY22_g8703 [Coprinellus aureogranulatus]
MAANSFVQQVADSMASRRQSPAPHKRVPLALKRTDGEPLTRADIQYDVLKAVFSDKTVAFTDPYSVSDNAPKLCFRDLYIKAIMHSSKATKALKDKMTESSLFAEDFSMLALLVNVGRINTTMSFFPEMKTAIRTYHPIPTLQRTSGNLQDAPRIKHILKQGLLESEVKDVPCTPDEILSRAKAGQIPATSVLNLLFVLSNHSSSVGGHFSQRFEFADVFTRTDISSASRARAFLWLCFNYLENPGSASDDYDEEEKPNPFADPTKDSAPTLVTLSPDEAAMENVDTPEEKECAENLISKRDQIIKANAATKDAGKEPERDTGRLDDDEQPNIVEEPKAKGRRKGSRTAAADKPEKPKRGGRGKAEKLRKETLKKEAKGSQSTTPLDGMSIEDDNSQRNSVPRIAGVDSNDEGSSLSFRVLGKDAGLKRRRASRRYSPYPLSPEDSQPRVLHQRVPERTMLEHAWYIVNNTDPLVDSDDEFGDEYDRHDYVQRLTTLSRVTQLVQQAFEFGERSYDQTFPRTSEAAGSS